MGRLSCLADGQISVPLLFLFLLSCVRTSREVPVLNSGLSLSPWGTVIVLTRCRQNCTSFGCRGIKLSNCPGEVPEVESLAKRLSVNVRLEYSDCADGGCERVVSGPAGERCESDEGRETGIILRWIIGNYHRFCSLSNPDGEIRKVIFAHSHERSLHTPVPTSVQISRLLSNECGLRYFLANDFGEVYMRFNDHVISKRWHKIRYDRVDILSVCHLMTRGTGFDGNIELAYQDALKHCSHNRRSPCMWRSGCNTAFFVSGRLLSSYKREDYLSMLANVRKLPHNLGSMLVSEIFERMVSAIFTGHGWPRLRHVPLDSCLGKPFVYVWRNGQWTTELSSYSEDI